MALNINNPEVDRLARELYDITDETITEAITQALNERLERETGKAKGNQIRKEIKRIQNRINRLSRLDKRSDEEIIGYNDKGHSI